jgi:hypothetical protein
LAASPRDEVHGWGLHVEKGYRKKTILSLVAVLVLFSAIFGVAWSVAQKDMQGGLSVSAAVLAFCGMPVMYLVAR